MMSRLESVEPSSITIRSTKGYGCSSTEEIARPSHRSELCEGTITDTKGPGDGPALVILDPSSIIAREGWRRW